MELCWEGTTAETNQRLSSFFVKSADLKPVTEWGVGSAAVKRGGLRMAVPPAPPPPPPSRRHSPCPPQLTYALFVQTSCEVPIWGRGAQFQKKTTNRRLNSPGLSSGEKKREIPNFMKNKRLDKEEHLLTPPVHTYFFNNLLRERVRKKYERTDEGKFMRH
jgi:hypothetical protein